MDEEDRTCGDRLCSLGILGLGLTGVWAHAAQQPAASPAPTFNPANFTGTVTPRATTDIRMNRYHFDPGARTKWHSHEGGQVLFAESGRLRVQERGKAVQEFAAGLDAPRDGRRAALARRAVSRCGDYADLVELRDDDLAGAGERSGLQTVTSDRSDVDASPDGYCCSIR